MTLQLSNLGYVGGHLHDLGDLAGGVLQCSSPCEDIILFAMLRGQNFLGLMRFTIFERGFHRAFHARFRPVLIEFVAI